MINFVKNELENMFVVLVIEQQLSGS